MTRETKSGGCLVAWLRLQTLVVVLPRACHVGSVCALCNESPIWISLRPMSSEFVI